MSFRCVRVQPDRRWTIATEDLVPGAGPASHVVGLTGMLALGLGTAVQERIFVTSRRAGVAIVSTALSLGCVTESPTLRAERVAFNGIVVGMTEQNVRDRLGPPKHVYNRLTAPANYYVPGYSYKQRPISGKVLIYVGIESIAYVYLDERATVEDVFVGGS